MVCKDIDLIKLLAVFTTLLLTTCTAIDSDRRGEQLGAAEEKELFLALESTESDEDINWRKKIRNQEDAISVIVDSYTSIAGFYNNLGNAYLEKKMFDLALQEFEKALQISPADPMLLYSAGICAANLSKLREEREFYLETAERYYLAAHREQEDHPEILYALSVFYVFERRNISAAQQYTEFLLRIRSDDVKGKFLLAHIFAAQGKQQEALTQYRELLESTMLTSEQRSRATENIGKLEYVQ